MPKLEEEEEEDGYVDCTEFEVSVVIEDDPMPQWPSEMSDGWEEGELDEERVLEDEPKE